MAVRPAPAPGRPSRHVVRAIAWMQRNGPRHIDPSETLSRYVIGVVEIDRQRPGESLADAFSAAVRGSDAPLVVIARAGFGDLVGDVVANETEAVMRSRPGVAALAIALRGSERAHEGLVAVERGSGVPLWPVALCLDVLRARVALGRIDDVRDDPWLWIIDALDGAPGSVAWASVSGPATQAAPERPAVIPARDPFLGEVNYSGAARPLPRDPGAMLDHLWKPVWASTNGDQALSVGGDRPSAAWRMLARILREPIEGATPLRLDDSGRPAEADSSSPVAGWIPGEALPGSLPLMLFRADGRLVLDQASDGDPVRRPEQFLGWGMEPLLSCHAASLMAPPDCIRVMAGDIPVFLHRRERPDTRGVFLGSDGVLHGEPPADHDGLPDGFLATGLRDGLAPVVEDGVVIGYAQPATRLAVRHIPESAAVPQPTRSVVRRARAALGRELRTRRADPRNVLLVMPWMTVGGADLFLRDLARDLSSSGFFMHAVFTYPRSESPPDNSAELAVVLQSLTCAPDDQPGTHLAYVINDICRRERIGTILICGGWQAYESLPGLRDALPGTRVIDVLFNDLGHIANNRRFARWIDVTTCAFQGLADLVIAGYGEDPSRVRTIYIGIDTDRFTPPTKEQQRELRVAMGLDPTRPVWGYAGRISPEKCIPDLVRAFAMVQERTGAQLVIQGDGPAEEVVAEALTRSDIQVLRRGFQPDQVTTLQALDAYLLPSRVEGIPLAIMEAAACGAVPVATAVGGVPDLVRPGFSGYLAAPENPGSLASALLALSDTPEWMASEMAANARAIVRRRMTWDTTVQAYAGLIAGPS